MLYDRIRVEAATDYTNLKDPKVFESYEKAMQNENGVEDSTGQLNGDITTNRLMQTPEYVKNLYKGWLADFDSVNTEMPIDDSVFQEAMAIADENPNMVLKNNDKQGGLFIRAAMSPYKMTANVANERLDALLRLHQSCQDEIGALTELADRATKRNKFLEKFFGPEEVKRRTEHYMTLMRVYQFEIVPQIVNRAKDVCGKVVNAFKEINELGKQKFDSKLFSHAAKKGTEFIKNLSFNMTKSNFSIKEVSFYLYNSILSGDGLSISRGSVKTRLKKVAGLSVLSKIIMEVNELTKKRRLQ